MLVSKFEENSNKLKKPTPVGFYEYTIITSQALKSYFNNFVNYKASKGLNVGAVTTASIYYYYQGDGGSNLYDNPGKIRSYLRDLYELGGTWVLLAGDFSVVPVRYGCGSNNTWDYIYYTEGELDTIKDALKIPADLYFADRNGNWNVDGDEFTGEISNDQPDYYPELFVGRLLCTTGQEINNWTNKLIKYEQNPGNGNSEYIIKCFMIESDQMQSNEFAEFLSTKLSSFNITIWKEIPGGGYSMPSFPTANQVLNEMNNRYGFYCWFAHGAPTDVTTMSAYFSKMPRYCLNAEDAIEFSTNQVIENHDALDNLTNIDYPAIIYSIGCDQTPFDNYHTEPNIYNLGESFTVKNLAGGPAFIGNTRLAFMGSEGSLFELFAGYIEDGINNIGVAELVSKANLNFNKHHTNYTNNLIGCPETKIHTLIPINKEYLNQGTEIIAEKFKLVGNYPNPFNPTTQIRYLLPSISDVELNIYDIMGNEIKSIKKFDQSAGYNEIIWDGRNNDGISVSSGIYFYRVKAVSLENNLFESSATSKMILIK